MEYAIFGALLSVSGSLLFVSAFRDLLLSDNKSPIIGSALTFFVLLLAGYIVPICTIAMAFDSRRSRRNRNYLHLGLLLIICFWFDQMVTILDKMSWLETRARSDAAVLICIVALTNLGWPILHFVFRSMARERS